METEVSIAATAAVVPRCRARPSAPRDLLSGRESKEEPRRRQPSIDGTRLRGHVSLRPDEIEQLAIVEALQ
jgi:hypothetical protein